MRGCLVSLLLLILVAANGYAIWQIHLLREDVHQLKTEPLGAAGPETDSLTARARSALRALERGQLEEAQKELDHIGELIEEGQATAAEHRARLAVRLAEAQEAVAAGSARASERIKALMQEIARLSTGRAEEDEDPSQEP